MAEYYVRPNIASMGGGGLSSGTLGMANASAPVQAPALHAANHYGIIPSSSKHCTCGCAQGNGYGNGLSAEAVLVLFVLLVIVTRLFQ